MSTLVYIISSFLTGALGFIGGYLICLDREQRKREDEMNLSSKLSDLKHKGHITDAEYKRLKQALNMAINSLKVDEMYDLEREDANAFVSMSVIEDIRAEIDSLDKGINSAYYCAIEDAKHIIDRHIEQYKEGRE